MAENEQGRAVTIPDFIFDQVEEYARRHGTTLEEALTKLLWTGIQAETENEMGGPKTPPPKEKMLDH